MKLLLFNAFYGSGSTGKIVKTLADGFRNYGNEVFVINGFNSSKDPNVYCLKKKHILDPLKKALIETRITGYNGFSSKKETERIINIISNIKPDIINAHILHGNYVNVSIFLNYLKEAKIPLVITMHDCWLYTGHCPHFSIYNCDKWQKECHDCDNLKKCKYPRTWFFDRSRKQFSLKREAFSNAKNFYIVGPCKWITSFIPKSPILKNLPSTTIYNGIDFYKVAAKSNEKFNQITHPEKKKLLFISNKLSISKGILEIQELSKLLPDDFEIVLVGKYDLKYKLNKNIICIGSVNSNEELAYIYDNCFAFINMTLADTFPTTNIECLQRGKPLLTYSTGGCAELGQFYGVRVCHQNTPEEMLKLITQLTDDYPNRNRITESGLYFSSKNMINNYLSLFKNIVGESK